MFGIHKSHKHNSCKKTMVEYLIGWSRYCVIKRLFPFLYYYRVSFGKPGDQPSASAYTRDCTEAGRGQSGGQPHRYSGESQPPASAHSGDCTEAGEGQSGGQPHRYSDGVSLQPLLTQDIPQRQGVDSLTETQVRTSVKPLITREIVQRQEEDSQEDNLTDPQVETSLQPLLTQEIVQRQGEDSQEDSLTDTQVRASLQPLLTQEEAGVGQSGGQPHRYSGRDQPSASSHSGDCTETGRWRTVRRTASQILR